MCRALQGELKDVMGVDVEIEEPINPDIIIYNDGSYTPMEIFISTY